MLFQGSSFSFDPGMFLSAFLYASSAAFFFAWSSAFGASCCCLFPFAIALTGATTASNAIAIAVMKFLIFKFFPNRIAPLRCPSDGGLLFTNGN